MSDPTARARQAFSIWREGLAGNVYEADAHLQVLVQLHGLAEAQASLRDFGAVVAGLDEPVRHNNRDEHLPRLARWDGVGNRTEGIDHHPSYHAIGRAAYGSGMMALYAAPGQERHTLALLYLLAFHGEGGHCCPMACTAGLIKLLQRGDDLHGWLPRLLDPDYDTHMHGAQFLTEVQGGSDVGANAVRAEPAADGGWRLSGEKYFCSVADAQLMLVTARPDGAPDGTAGVRAFAVPRHLPNGRVNGFFLRRLKFKLGTRSMASGEIDFDRAWAWPLGDFKDTVEIVLNTSRLYNAVVACGMLQRALREAAGYARCREAFGRHILAFPAVAQTIASLRTRAIACRGLTFLLAAQSDRIALDLATERERQAFRMLVNLNKFWTSLVCTAALRDAIEVLGGNGAIEEFTVLPRLLRDSIVCEQWEGPHNVLCAQVLRDSQRLGLHRPLFDWLAGLLPSEHPLRADLARVRERFERVVQSESAVAAARIRDVCLELMPVAQAVALAWEVEAGGAHGATALALEHLMAPTRPGYDALEDAGRMERVRELVEGV